MFRLIVLLIFCCLSLASPSLASDLYGKGELPSQTRTVQADWLPPYHPREEKTGQYDPQKMLIAKKLSAWVREVMIAEHANIAIIGRQGNKLTKRFDATGLAHAGFVLHQDQGQEPEWVTLNLFADPATKKRTQDIWQASIEDFYYGQTGYGEDTLILIPSPELQKKLLQGFRAGNYRQLWFTDQYNLIAYPYTLKTLNCTKWLLMNLYAADSDVYKPEMVLKRMQQHFQEQVIRPDFLTRIAMRFMTNVRLDEHKSAREIHTVTVQSLTKTNWFPITHAYAEHHRVESHE